MKELHETLTTPKELDSAKVMSQVKQWQERKSGRLGFYKIGAKNLYGQKHLDAYFAACERNAQQPPADGEGYK